MFLREKLQVDGSGKRNQNTTDNNVLVPAPQLKERCKYGGNFMVWCCPKAFTPTSACIMALCPNCYTSETKDSDEGGEKRPRRGRNVTDKATNNKSVAKSTLTNKKRGVCPDHIREDMKYLESETNKGYLKERRKNLPESALENIVTNCIVCGFLL